MDSALIVKLFVEAMLPMAMLVIAGGYWRSHYPVEHWIPLRAGLNTLVLDVFTPVLLFAVAAKTPLEPQLLVLPLLITIAIAAATLALYFILFRLPWFAGLSDATRATLMVCGMFGNTFYLGIPILSSLYGPTALRYPAFTDMIASIPLVWSLGVWVLTCLGKNSAERVSLWRLLTRLPLLWAFALGLVANLCGLNFISLTNACQMIGAAAVPIMLFIFGLSIPWRSLRPSPAVLSVCAVKLLLCPLVVWLFVHAVFQHPSEAQHAGILEAAMPTFLTSIVMAERFGGDIEAASLTIGWCMLLLWLSLPLVLLLIK